MRVKIRDPNSVKHFKENVCYKKDYVILRFRSKNAPGIVSKLSTLSARKRLDKGFKSEEDFLRWLNGEMRILWL